MLKFAVSTLVSRCDLASCPFYRLPNKEHSGFWCAHSDHKSHTLPNRYDPENIEDIFTDEMCLDEWEQCPLPNYDPFVDGLAQDDKDRNWEGDEMLFLCWESYSNIRDSDIKAGIPLPPPKNWPFDEEEK